MSFRSSGAESHGFSRGEEVNRTDPYNYVDDYSSISNAMVVPPDRLDWENDPARYFQMCGISLNPDVHQRVEWFLDWVRPYVTAEDNPILGLYSTHGRGEVAYLYK